MASRSVQPFFCTAHRSVPLLYNGLLYLPQKLPLLLVGSGPPSNTWYLGPTWVIIPKRHLDRFSRFCMGRKCYAVQCIVSGKEKPKNCPFPLGTHHLAGGRLSHGHRQHAQIIGKDCTCCSGVRLIDRQTHTHTNLLITILRRHSHGDVMIMVKTAKTIGQL